MEHNQEIALRLRLKNYSTCPYRYRYDKRIGLWQVFEIHRVIIDGPRIKGLDVEVYDVYETELEAIEKTLELNKIELKIRPDEKK